MDWWLLGFFVLAAWSLMGTAGWLIVCVRYGYEGSRDLVMLPVCVLFGPVALGLGLRA